MIHDASSTTAKSLKFSAVLKVQPYGGGGEGGGGEGGGGTRASAATSVHTEEQMADVLRHVNAEYARSKKGRWRRLLPSPKSAQYAEFFEAHQHCHALSFDTS